jgi:hypothetical protein
LPTVDNAYTFVVDQSGNGKPDLPDKTPPELSECYVVASNDTLVYVVFSEQVDSVTATKTGNYTVFETSVPSNTVAVLSAEMEENDVVLLSLAQSIGSGYSCAVSFVSDLSCYRNTITPGSTIEIYYDASGIDTDQPRMYSGRLYQNYPNPFNPSTTIRFEVPGKGLAGAAAGFSRAQVTEPVQLAVYDVMGRLVKTLVSDEFSPGLYSVVWDGTDNQGMTVGSGVYFYRLVSGNSIRTKKMVLLK